MTNWFSAVDCSAGRRLCGLQLKARRGEACGLPAESVVLHGNHERSREPTLIVFVMKWSFFHFVPTSSIRILRVKETRPPILKGHGRAEEHIPEGPEVKGDERPHVGNVERLHPRQHHEP